MTVVGLPISAIGAVSSFGTTGAAAASGAGAASAATSPAAQAAAAVNGTASTGSTGFGNALQRGLDNLESVQNNADSLAQAAATGNLTDVHDYMIAATQASLATSLTLAVRNKAVDAFNDVMRMQL